MQGKKKLGTLYANSLDKIFGLLVGRLHDFSLHKFASNVVEKAICLADETQIRDLVSELLEGVAELVVDKFGNFVIQKTLKKLRELNVSDLEQEFVIAIDGMDAEAKQGQYVKHVHEYLVK